MIDMERIEKAYLRFKVLHDTLVFKAVEMKSDEKDQHGKSTEPKLPRWEVRCNSRFIYLATGSGAEVEAKTIAAELNDLLSSFLEKKYTDFLDEVIVSKVHSKSD